MIQIELNLFVTLAKYHPKGRGPVELEAGTSVDRLIRDLGIPRDLVKLIFVNGKKAGIDHILVQGDRLGLFPPVGGG